MSCALYCQCEAVSWPSHIALNQINITIKACHFFIPNICPSLNDINLNSSMKQHIDNRQGCIFKFKEISVFSFVQVGCCRGKIYYQSTMVIRKSHANQCCHFNEVHWKNTSGQYVLRNWISEETDVGRRSAIWNGSCWLKLVY